MPPHFTPRRSLGRTGFVATPLGIGDLADRNVPLEQCVATALRALHAGLNVIDTAPGYEDGYSEQVVGAAVRQSGLPRESIFVTTKIDHPDQPISPQIDASLSRLQLDHIDFLALHGCSDPAVWARATATGGAFEHIDRAIAAGKVRFKGISSHNPVVLLPAIQSGLCDVVMFAVGPYVDPRYVQEALPLAKKLNVGTICFKTFGAGKLLGDTEGYSRPLSHRPRGKLSSGGQTSSSATLPRLTVEECLHYTLTQDPDVALLGLSFPNEQDAAWVAYQSFPGPKDPAWMESLRESTKIAIQDKGPCWWNPEGK